MLALRTLCTGITFFALDALLALRTLCTGITFFTLNTLFALSTGVALFTLDTLLALVTFVALIALVAFCTDNNAEIGNRVVRKGYHKLAVCVDFGRNYADAVVALVAFFALCALNTCVALVTLSTDNNPKVCGLVVGVCNNELTVGIYLGRNNAYSVLTVSSDNFIKVHLFAVGEGNYELSFIVYSRFCDADSVLAVFSVSSAVAVDSVFAVLAVRTNRSSYVYFGFISKGQNQFTLAVKLSSLDANSVFARGCFEGRCPLLFSARIAVFFCYFIGGFSVKAFEPFLNSSFVSVLYCQFISRQTVFNHSCRCWSVVKQPNSQNCCNY